MRTITKNNASNLAGCCLPCKGYKLCDLEITYIGERRFIVHVINPLASYTLDHLVQFNGELVD